MRHRPKAGRGEAHAGSFSIDPESLILIYLWNLAKTQGALARRLLAIGTLEIPVEGIQLLPRKPVREKQVS